MTNLAGISNGNCKSVNNQYNHRTKKACVRVLEDSGGKAPNEEG